MFAHFRIGAVLAFSGIALSASAALADEGGVSFWLPGTFGSLAAVPQEPGFSFSAMYYHTAVNASGSTAASREILSGKIPSNISVNTNLSLKATGDIELLSVNYAFANPVLGAQFAIGVTEIVGRAGTSLSGNLTTVVGGVVTTRTGTMADSNSGLGDLFPIASLKWNRGDNNFMTYLTGGIPIGSYDSTRLSNMGIGHGAIDGGAGYTYFDQASGHEFSAVAGVTYNFKNTTTQYQNGVDFHLDFAASQFLSEQFFVGGVGYFYDQLSADSGTRPFQGNVRSRVAAIGPQLGYIFPVNGMQGFLGLKGTREFASIHRPDGWNASLTFAVSPAAAAATRPASNMVSKY
jgi:hypothetical protein